MNVQRYELHNQKLELGAGDRPTPGFIHNDARDLVDIEIVCPAEEITEFVVGQASEVRATHLLEHFSHRDTERVLLEWYDVIADGGMIYIEVPNFEWQCRNLGAGSNDDAEIVRLAYGDQDHAGNFHKTGFTKKTLHDALESAGFRRIDIHDIGMVFVARAFKLRREG